MKSFDENQTTQIMTRKGGRVLGISALPAVLFRWDYGVYLFFGEFVAKLFLVIILIAGAWSYHELKNAVEIPPEEEPTDNNSLQNTKHSINTEQDD